MDRSAFVPPFRVTPEERRLLAQLAPRRGDLSRLLRRLVKEEAQRRGLAPAPGQKQAA